jgi:hypothetical protein
MIVGSDVVTVTSGGNAIGMVAVLRESIQNMCKVHSTSKGPIAGEPGN